MEMLRYFITLDKYLEFFWELMIAENAVFPEWEKLGPFLNNNVKNTGLLS